MQKNNNYRKKYFFQILLAICMIWGYMCFSDISVRAEEIDNYNSSSGKLGDNITYELSDDGVLTVSGTGEMNNYTEDTAPFRNNFNVKEIVITGGVTRIGDYVFDGATAVNKVTMEEGVTEVGKHAFGYNYSLSEVNFPTSLRTIQSYAFESCGFFGEVNLPEGLVKVESYAFSNMGVQNLTIPSTLEDMDDAFFAINKLETVSVAAGNKKYDSRDGSNALIETDTNKLILGGAESTIPDTVTSIGYHAFNGHVTDIKVPKSVTEIGREAFDCKWLKKLEISGTTTIGWKAIPEGLDELVLNNVVFMNNYTFSNIMYDNNSDSYNELIANKNYNITLKSEYTKGNIMHGGRCGDIDWSIDKDGTLTLSGDGQFQLKNEGIFVCDPDGNEYFVDSVLSRAWMKYHSDIKTAKIKVSGVSTITDIFSGEDADGNYASCENLESVDFTGSDLSNVHSMVWLLSYSDKLKEVIMGSKVNTSALCDITEMFYGCTKLEKVDMSGMDLSSLTQAHNVFGKCQSLKYINTPYKMGKTAVGLVHNMKKASGEVFDKIPEYSDSSISLEWDGKHSELEDVRTIEEATCISTGKRTGTCSTCGAEVEEIVEKNPYNHVGGTEIRGAKAATTTDEGYTGDTYCKGCNAKIATGTIISKVSSDSKTSGEYNESSKNNSLSKGEDGNWYDYNDGVVTSYTGLKNYNGAWWYVKDGKVDFGATTLCKYNGSWWYVKNGKVDFNATTLCKFNGSWFYVKGGKVDFSATTLCKYNGSWFYVKGGKVDFSATTLCKYNGSWFYVKGGKVDFNATTLCKYNGTWWYVKGGKIDFKSTTLCKYNGTWFYVNGGKVNFGANGLCKYNGVWWYIKNGRVSFTNTLCKFNGTWWYINNGAVNFNKTTLVKYGNNWYAVAGGKVAWGYTGNLKYNGGTYRIVNGVVKF